MRPVGTAQELERRRRHAVELMQRGESPTVVAHILGVGRTSLYRWLALAEKSPEALAARPHPGPRPTDERLRELERLLLEGARAHGRPDDRDGEPASHPADRSGGVTGGVGLQQTVAGETAMFR
ncbi:helix-turn-helix domain-containing protein, partial [Paludisphaera soli]|uniref:helix-turn-helix domain-containing protein n=1 Tax=Paludisphaera soli TaxID=2712865 RepID=UPI0013EAD2A2